MSNTLNTPVEALELEFPLRVVEYALRRGSGGAGRHRGGDGVVRELEALRADDASRCSPSAAATRRRAPAAASRARAGATCSTASELPREGARRRCAPGQRLRIETPGGGGARLATSAVRAVRQIAANCRRNLEIPRVFA